MDKNLVDWYSSYLISRKDKLQRHIRTVVADAFFLWKHSLTLCVRTISMSSAAFGMM